MRLLKESRFLLGGWSPVYSAECHNLQKYYKLFVFNYTICVFVRMCSQSPERVVLGPLGSGSH